MPATCPVTLRLLHALNVTTRIQGRRVPGSGPVSPARERPDGPASGFPGAGRCQTRGGATRTGSGPESSAWRAGRTFP